MRFLSIRRLLLPLSIGLGCLTILVSFLWSHHQNKVRTVNQLIEETIIWTNGMDRTLSSIKQELIPLASKIRNKDIEEQHALLQKFIFNQPLLREVNFIHENHLVCSNHSVPKAPSPVSDANQKIIPDWGQTSIALPENQTDNISSIFLNYRVGEQSLINVVISRESLIAPLRFKRPAITRDITFLRGDGTTLLHSGVDSARLFSTVPKLGISVINGDMIYCHPVNGFDLYAVSIVPASRLVQSWISELPIYGLLALTTAILFVVGGWRLKSRYGGLKAELEEAIYFNQIQAFLQPIIEIKTNRCVGAEALMRWRHPTRGLIPPPLFIPEAERSGLITKMTYSMIKLIGMELKDLLKQHPDFQININLSSISLNDQGFYESIMQFVNDSIQSHQLCFEITESASLSPAAIDCLHEFHRQGIKLAVDDFGTGYSNLGYLVDNPFDYLKIDRAFVEGISTDGQSSGLVDTVIQIGKNCSLTLVGEGIEKQYQADYLQNAGVDLGQGYLFARPMPIEEFIDWFTASSTR